MPSLPMLPILRTRSTLRQALSGYLLVIFTSAQVFGATFMATHLKELDQANFFFPEALSENGAVGGYTHLSFTTFPSTIATIWDQSGLPRALPVDGTFASGSLFGFTSSGQPVGTFARIGQYPNVPVVWRDEKLTNLADFGSGGSAVTGNASAIVGQTFDVIVGVGITRVTATIWNDQGASRVTGLGNIDSYSFDISASGNYVGVTNDYSDPRFYGGFIGRNGTAQRLNFPGFPATRGYEINDSGWFTGVYEPTRALQRGYVARINLDTGEQEIHDLGLFGNYNETWAYAINNDNTIVGAAADGPNGDFEVALIWTNGSRTPQDLNPMVTDLPADVTLINAYRINNAGQILAEARGPDGFSYYRLDPVIPEPAGAASAFLSLVFLRRRRNAG